jgi:plastocyanin
MLTVDMYDSYYGTSDTNMTEPPIWTIPAGSDVVVNLINHGAYDHNWAIVKKGITVPVPYEEGQAGDIIMHGIGMVYNNSQTTITFSAPDLGEYQVICTVSGHYPLMQGKLLVTESGQVASE